MAFEQEITIDAPPERVWEVMTDIERWPEWTASMKKVERVGEGPFSLGSRAKLWIRGATGSSEWTVTKLQPQRSFTWESRLLPGLVSTADHEFTPSGAGTHVMLRVTMSGPLARIGRLLLGNTSRSNMKMEAEGLKARAEGTR